MHYFNAEDDQLIAAFQLNKTAQLQKAFSQSCGKMNYVFINNASGQNEKLFLLLHELGHIVFHHDFSQLSVEAEMQANQFAKRHLKGKSSFPKIIGIGLAGVAVLVVGIVALFPKNSTTASPPAADAQAVPSPVVQSASPSVMVSQSLERDTIVFLTSSGHKYHKQSCFIIKNKNNLVEMSLATAQALGKEPCGVCFSESPR